MRKSVVAMTVVGSLILVGGVLAGPKLAASLPHRTVTRDVPGGEPTMPIGPGGSDEGRNAKRIAVEAPESFRRWDKESRAMRVEAPFKLTASDGTGLALTGLDARAVVEGPLAFTELRMAFENPTSRVIEGRFQISLPANASVSRFAMRIGDRWQEGEVVEKKRARRAYEDFLHRKQDPALLEQAAGNEFTARVFPIPAHGVKEIILSYSHEIDRDYTLPLRGLPTVGTLAVRATDASGRVLGERNAKTSVPAEDFVVHANDENSSLRSGNLVVARVRPVVDTAPDALTDTLVLVDTSASRSLGFADQVELVSRFVAAIAESHGAGARVNVACFDQNVESVFEGAAGEFGENAKAKMNHRGALGASNLEGALAWAKNQANEKHYKRVVVITDGVSTAGHTDAAALKSAALALGSAGIERLDAIGAGGIRDEAGLKLLVTAGLTRDGVVADAAGSFSTLGRKLASRTRSNIGVRVAGASWVYPTRLDGVQPGDEVLVYAELKEGEKAVVSLDYASKSGTVSEKLDIGFKNVDRALVERAWAKAKISALSETLADVKDAKEVSSIEKQIVALSTQNRVLSPYTSLLVLETEQDFARYDIDRKALANILTVNDGRLAVAARSWGSKEDLETKEQPSRKDSRPLGPAQKAAAAEAAPGAATPVANSAPPPPPQAVAKSEGGDQRDVDEKKKDTESDGFGRLGGSHRPTDSNDSALGQASQAPDPESAQLGSIGTLGHGAGGAQPSATTAMARPTSPAPRAAAAPVGGMDATREEARRDTGRSRNRGILADSLAESTEDFVPNREMPSSAAPYTGNFKTVMDSIARGQKPAALESASRWHQKDPGDVMALVALGEAYEANQDVDQAARAYGSLIDLFSSRADLRRFAGERLERLSGVSAAELAVDSYEKALADRPDHPSSHRLLAWAHVKNKNYAKAVDVLEAARKLQFPRFEAADRILNEDLGIVASAWLAAGGVDRTAIQKRLAAVGASIDTGASLRFVLNWETDANDVDFHIFDSSGGHAFYSNRDLPSGGSLYADITTGYGPECFTIRKGKWQRDAKYTLQAHYYSRGPMGYGMGKLQVIDHDGKGGLKVEDRPFVVMVDQAFVNLGTVKR